VFVPDMPLWQTKKIYMALQYRGKITHSVTNEGKQKSQKPDWQPRNNKIKMF
jgi:hypothetical protein